MKKNSKAVGLCIKDDSLVALEISRDDKSYILENVSQVKFSSKHLQKGRIMSSGEFQDAIHKLFNTQGISRENVYLSIPENDIIVRLLKIPDMTEKEIRNYIAGEVEQYTVFKDEEVSFDWSKIGEEETKGAKQILLLLVVSSKLLPYSYYNVFKEVGIKIKCIEPVSLSLGRYYGKLLKNISPKAIGIISCFNELSNFYIFQEDKILFTRSIDIGMKNLQDVDISQEEGRDIKNLQDFADEILRTLRFYQSQFPDLELSGFAFWCPDRYSSVPVYLQKKINYSVEYAYFRADENLKIGSFVNTHIDPISLDVSVCVGCAKLHFEKDEYKFNVNILPSRLRYGFEMEKKFLLAAGLIPFFILSTSIYTYLLKKDIDKIQQQIKQVDAKIQELDTRAQSKDDLQNKIAQVKSEIEQLKRLEKIPYTSPVIETTYNISTFLRDMKYLIPQDVWISASSFNGTNFTILGYSLTQEGIAKFLVNLVQIGSFSWVGLEYSREINLENRSVFEYKINCGGKNI